MIGRQKRFSFDRHCIASKKFTNTAARVTPMKSAPNVFPRSRLGGERFWVEEDIVNWPELFGGMLYIFSATVLLAAMLMATVAMLMATAAMLIATCLYLDATLMPCGVSVEAPTDPEILGICDYLLICV
jgi:hypothetical protein